MKPFILNFAVKPEKDVPFPELSYCDEKNLSVLTSTGEVAIEKSFLSTETFSKSTDTEQSDTDFSNDNVNSNIILSTMTKTGVDKENVDSDLYNDEIYNVRKFLATETLTATREVSDSEN